MNTTTIIRKSPTKINLKNNKNLKLNSKMNILPTFRKPYLSFVFALTLLTFSCSQEQIISEEMVTNSEIAQSSFIQNEVFNNDLKTNFVSFQNSKYSNKSYNNIEFDNEHIYEVALNEKSPSLFMANQVGFDEKNSENYAFAAVKLQNGFSKALIVKTTKVNENLYQIDYLDENFDIILIAELDALNQTIIFNQGNSSLNQLKCGQATSDCLQDVYTKHGWVSVWAFVQTAFIPATGVALAAACAADSCL